MGKFDDVDDDELENEVKRRKSSRGRDRVVILEGSHATRFLKEGRYSGDDDDEKKDK